MLFIILLSQILTNIICNYIIYCSFQNNFTQSVESREKKQNQLFRYQKSASRLIEISEWIQVVQIPYRTVKKALHFNLRKNLELIPTCSPWTDFFIIHINTLNKSSNLYLTYFDVTSQYEWSKNREYLKKKAFVESNQLNQYNTENDIPLKQRGLYS